MYTATMQGNKVMPYVNELVADTLDDLEKINVSTLAPGSICIIIDSSQVFMLNTQREWVQL